MSISVVVLHFPESSCQSNRVVGSVVCFSFHFIAVFGASRLLHIVLVGDIKPITSVIDSNFAEEQTGDLYRTFPCLPGPHQQVYITKRDARRTDENVPCLETV